MLDEKKVIISCILLLAEVITSLFVNTYSCKGRFENKKPTFISRPGKLERLLCLCRLLLFSFIISFFAYAPRVSRGTIMG